MLLSARPLFMCSGAHWRIALNFFFLLLRKKSTVRKKSVWKPRETNCTITDERGVRKQMCVARKIDAEINFLSIFWERIKDYLGSVAYMALMFPWLIAGPPCQHQPGPRGPHRPDTYCYYSLFFSYLLVC
jgi:hypothetical protein